MVTIKGTFEFEQGQAETSLLKFFTDMSIMLRGEPKAKFSISNGETTLKKD